MPVVRAEAGRDISAAIPCNRFNKGACDRAPVRLFHSENHEREDA